MTDLRAILGDKYGDVMQAACGCDGTRVPHCFECSDSTWDHECPGPVPCTHRAAGAILARVLPDLLAEANTRAEDAEAKARRFANLLANYNNVINATLPREVLRQKADAWDEGYHAGHEDARAVQPTYPDPTPNPYHPEKP